MGNLDDLLQLTLNFRLPGASGKELCEARSAQRAHGMQN
jgi:hypothetical protein